MSTQDPKPHAAPMAKRTAPRRAGGPQAEPGERHIVLVTYGEPPTPSFFSQLRYSWRILLGLTRMVADIPKPVLPLIALYRGYSRNRLWTRERYGSALERITDAEAKRMSETLTRLAPETVWHVYVAYEFRDPLIPVALRRIPNDAQVDIVPMYVSDSAFTHEISRATLRDLRGASNARVLPALPEETMADLSANHLMRELASRGVEPDKDWALVLATHGTLLEPKRPIETGRLSTERICKLIESRVQDRFGMVIHGWLNHDRGGRWTEPPMNEALSAVVTRGFKKAVYFPCGFLADNAESELEGSVFLRGQTELDAVHIACMNDSAELVEALARQVIGDAATVGAGDDARNRRATGAAPRDPVAAGNH